MGNMTLIIAISHQVNPKANIDKQYQKSHTNICCPIINTCIWETSDLMRKNFFELTSGYLGYLSIGFFCIELQEKYMDKIL